MGFKFLNYNLGRKFAFLYQFKKRKECAIRISNISFFPLLENNNLLIIFRNQKITEKSRNPLKRGEEKRER